MLSLVVTSDEYVMLREHLCTLFSMPPRAKLITGVVYYLYYLGHEGLDPLEC